MIETLGDLRRPGDQRGPRSGHRRQAGRPGQVPGAAGLWRDLTDNVNQLAANLTTQVRAIAEVATAVTKGDLTRSITVEASGEVAALKDNINEMIRNLKDHDAEEHRAGLAEDQPGPVHAACCRASATCRPVSQHGAVRSWPRWSTRSTACSTSPTRRERPRRCSTWPASYASNQASTWPTGFRPARRPGRPVRAPRSQRILLTNVPPGLHQDQLGPGRGRAAEHHRRCRSCSKAS